MSDYISREAAIRYAESTGTVTAEGLPALTIGDLEDIPAADVAPVVRCRECKHRTNFQRITETPEALAAWIVQAQKSDPALLWCHDSKGCLDLGEDFICTDELQSGCILAWLNSPVKEG